jgi:hypothetical protein
MMQGSSSATCALAELDGIDATVTDVHKGVAIRFVAPPAERERLREAVRDMATPRAGGMFDIFAGCACTPGRPSALSVSSSPAKAGSAQRAGATSMQPIAVVVPAMTRENDTATGAVLVLWARTDEEGAALSTAVREKMAAMRGGCP